MTTNSIVDAKKKALGLLILLGALTAFDSIAIDMYLPAFTAMENDLSLAEGIMPMSLSVFLIGLAVGQAVCGSLADSLGRKRPLMVGILLFGAASCLVALSTNLSMLMIGRFLQGIGGATGLVIPRVIVSDIYDDKQAPRIFTFLVQVQSISPILAPLLGGLVLVFAGWRVIFWILAAFAGIAFLVAQPGITETQPVEARVRLTFMNVFKGYWDVLRNRRYLGMLFANGFIMGTLLGYISSSASTFMTYFKLPPSTYSLLFAAFSIGMLAVGQLNMYLLSKMDLKRNLSMGFFIHLLFLCLLLIGIYMGYDSLWLVCGLLFLAMASLSFLFGGLTSEAMFSVHHKNFGSAAALLGVMQYAIGGGAGILLGIVHDGTLMPTIAVLCGCSFLSLLCWMLAANLRNAFH